ncbi:site-specific integrase [Kineococcus sp. NBC_00420]|uniref:tyrosine-type recombinase/integrase n=1 Tax=Kineococcus sp. NBC_00420 TaxID=2903564 RepID=UPI002E1DCF5B
MKQPDRFLSWAEIDSEAMGDATELTVPMHAYLRQIATTLRSGSVRNSDIALRCFTQFMFQEHPQITRLADVRRVHIEDYKPWLAARTNQRGKPVTAATRAHRLGNLRTFFIRIRDWDWPQAPPTVPILFGDLPRQEKPLPKALDDAAAAKFLRAAQTRPRLLERVICEVLIRTGLRVGEFTGLRRDAVRQIGAGHWLHVPVGKLLDDRYIPLHPQLVELIADYRDRFVDPAHPLLLPRENGIPMDRYSVTRCLNNVATAAGLGHVHPHQMRHTLATQAINRGMSLEAIAALLGHHSMDMTLRYAKIANRTVADEYFAVTEKVEALYAAHDPDNLDGENTALPASAAGPEMARLHREMHQRMLGNGFCTRPPALDCTFESVCETCTFFQTSIAFRPTLQAQYDHAAEHDQQGRQQLFAGLLRGLDQPAS